MRNSATAFVALAISMVVAWKSWPWLAAASQMMRIRALMGAVSICVFLIALLAIRNYKLREKYAVLWLATAGMITLAAIFPQLMDLARAKGLYIGNAPDTFLGAGYQTARHLLDAEIASILSLGIEAHTNVTVGSDIWVEDLQKEGYGQYRRLFGSDGSPGSAP